MPSRRARIMTLVVTGGSKASVTTNRRAVATTWADDNTYFVTADDVDYWPRLIRLPPAAEKPGPGLLSRKVLHMWAHVAEHYTEQYDFFIKADDDTYVNLPRLAQDLSWLDPDVPMYLGAKRFGANIKGTPAPGALWQSKNYMKFAHGGAG